VVREFDRSWTDLGCRADAWWPDRTYARFMRTRTATLLAIVGVLAAGGTAGLVNARALDGTPNQSTITIALQTRESTAPPESSTPSTPSTPSTTSNSSIAPVASTAVANSTAVATEPAAVTTTTAIAGPSVVGTAPQTSKSLDNHAGDSPNDD